MKTSTVLIVLFLGLGIVSSNASSQTLTPAEQIAANARKAIAANPDRYEPYNQLALALARRARETSDPGFYNQAEESVKTSLMLSPDNFEAEKIQVWLLLGKHEFAQALSLATTLNKRAPDDVQVYGYLTDANVELGNYKDAEDACQWMLDLRHGNIGGLTRAAYLREVFGDIEGSIELMRQAFDRTSPSEVEDRAWMLTQLGHLELLADRPANADAMLTEALNLFPDYHYALANLAAVRTAQGRHTEAIALLQKHVAMAPHAENFLALGEALDRAGRKSEAQAVYAQFESKARAEMQTRDNANRELVLYYANDAKKPADALKVAELEIAQRHDVHTLDVYAWALHVNNRDADAAVQIDKALAVGVKDPIILDHARTIAGKGGAGASRAAK